MSKTNVGASILAMGELSRIENQARDSAASAAASNTAAIHAGWGETVAKRATATITFAAKSQIHGMRARIESHILAENELISALRTVCPNHPLVDRDVVNEIVERGISVTRLDPEVIKRTYPSGVIPDGAMPEVAGMPGVVGVVNGEPAFPAKSWEWQGMMSAFKFTEETVNDPAVVQACIDRQSKYVEQLINDIAADDKKSFFTSLSKDKREALEVESKASIRQLGQLNIALPAAQEFIKEQKEEKVRRDVAKAKLEQYFLSMKGQ